MLEHLSVDQSLTPARISEFGTRVPSLLILMPYGRPARLPILIDDEAVLPKSLPAISITNYQLIQWSFSRLSFRSSPQVKTNNADKNCNKEA